MIYLFITRIRKGSEMYNRICSLCGQKIANEKSSKQQLIDGTLYLFDSDSCLATFNKFQEVYGKDFTKGLAVTN